ncbi:MAG TPA: hypothetical protein VD789_05530, partial [Thermomicrobiales bacterium]|nr:hypothetical protein [Thermomicrobiales bacterium]
MVAEQTRPEITYQGSDSQKALAERAFQVVRAQGMFASEYAPIRVRLDALAGFLEVSETDALDAIRANAQVFGVVEEEDTTWVVSSRQGTPPLDMVPDTRHTFAERFMTPEPAPERPLRTEKPERELVVNTEIGDAIEDAEEAAMQVERDLRMEDGIEVDEGMTVEIISEAPARAET